MWKYSPRRRPDGEGANLDRCLVPYHGKCQRIQFIYMYIYIYIHEYIYRGWPKKVTIIENMVNVV